MHHSNPLRVARDGDRRRLMHKIVKNADNEMRRTKRVGIERQDHS